MGKGGRKVIREGGRRTEGSEHGPSGVDDLDLAVPGEGCGIGRQSLGVPAIVTGELSLQVCWWLCEWACTPAPKISYQLPP